MCICRGVRFPQYKPRLLKKGMDFVTTEEANSDERFESSLEPVVDDDALDLSDLEVHNTAVSQELLVLLLYL